MVKVLGHRGARQRKGVDENSVPALEIGFTEGDGIETDVVLSADNIPIVCHEQRSLVIPRLYSRSIAALKRHLNKASAKLVGKKRLDEMTAAEISQLRLKNGSEIPQLSALFALAARHPGKTIDIELKAPGTAAPVIAEIHKAVAAGQIKKEQVVLTSFEHEAIAEAKRLDPDIKCGFIIARKDQHARRIYPWTGNKSRYSALTDKMLTGADAKTAQPDYFIMTPAQVSAKGVKKIRQHFPGAKVMLWSSRKPEKYRRLEKVLKDPAIGPHVEAVITDFPGRMAKELKKKGLKP